MSNSDRHKAKRLKRARSYNRSGNMSAVFNKKMRQQRANRDKEPSLEEMAKKMGLK